MKLEQTSAASIQPRDILAFIRQLSISSFQWATGKSGVQPRPNRHNPMLDTPTTASIGRGGSRRFSQSVLLSDVRADTDYVHSPAAPREV
ncbi:hypothetical protein BBBOND_0403950 [Babesia bigemina]|uniref:Uncharacterized protein n=1 Tax=Babesia bigemina TaxID=5866 RepID=A0A061DCN8_BABBI|nr:hypothetical protein BBBOND_0403950 [Babesia bigemina]CDR97907.1 hypothetical protein BBBOND_0403950 [Babesia bigemina]|eukprot:XP_012770093.1 hypothetical protein BBBOND_0403950 [Babesia bigemina]